MKLTIKEIIKEENLTSYNELFILNKENFKQSDLKDTMYLTYNGITIDGFLINSKQYTIYFYYNKEEETIYGGLFNINANMVETSIVVASSIYNTYKTGEIYDINEDVFSILKCKSLTV